MTWNASRQTFQEWRGSRLTMRGFAGCGILLAAFLIWTTFLAFHPEWDKHPPDEPFALIFCFATFGSFFFLSCWGVWACLHARVRLSATSLEFQEGQRPTSIVLADVVKISWWPRWRKVKLFYRNKSASLEFGVYASADQRAIAAALRAALPGREETGWDAFARIIRKRTPPPISLPKSADKILASCSLFPAVSLLAAVGLFFAPNRFELRRLFWLLEFFCLIIGSSFTLLIIWELIRYQRTWKIWVGLALALATSGVAAAAIVHAVSSQLVQLPLR